MDTLKEKQLQYSRATFKCRQETYNQSTMWELWRVLTFFLAVIPDPN